MLASAVEAAVRVAVPITAADVVAGYGGGRIFGFLHCVHCYVSIQNVKVISSLVTQADALLTTQAFRAEL